MGLAIDTVQAFATAGAASPFPTALAPAPGDSLTVRNFATTDTAKIVALLYSAGGGQKVRISSPMLHDNVTGITFEPAEVPAAFLLGEEVGVKLTPGDTLTVNGGIAAAGTITAGLVNYYSNLPGASARLHMWADISGIIKSIKSVEVDLGAIAVGAWTDTLITATENQLHAHTDYAVLGYTASAAVDILGVKGQATGNLRVCGPGPTSTLDLTDYFLKQSIQRNIPYIPVFNGDDKGAFYVSAANHVAVGGGATHAYLVLAELSQTVTP
jgi:hypothetical protein